MSTAKPVCLARCWPRLLLSGALVLSGTPSAAAQKPTSLAIEVGVDASGQASARWLAMMRRKVPPAAYDSVAAVRRPVTAEDGEWIQLIRARALEWEAMVPPVAALYLPALPPSRVFLVLGNRGGEDAFTHDARTIGFDLAVLQANYGSARQPANLDRVDRFFRHEFTHLMQKAWLAMHPWRDRSPTGAALVDMWAEGLGNFYSLSDRWINAGGLTPLALRTLAELEPQLVAHLDTISCGNSTAAVPHLATLSAGPFARKWGALPVALWLAVDMQTDSAALRSFIVAGPEGVWQLAYRHVATPLMPRLRAIRAASARCATP